MDLSSLKTDSALEEEGVAVEYDDAKITIRGSGYKKYEDYLLREQTRPANRRIIQKQNPRSARLVQKITKAGIAKFIWLSHENLAMDGEPLPNTYEAKLKALEYRDFFNFIDGESERIENFQREAVAEDAAVVKSMGGVEAKV